MPESESRYFTQLRQTLNEKMQMPWQNVCEGHTDIYKAMTCHDGLKASLERLAPPPIRWRSLSAWPPRWRVAWP